MIPTILNDLKSYTDLTNLVQQRIYRNYIPENAVYPLITYDVEHEPQNTLAGPSSLQKWVLTLQLYSDTQSTNTNIRNFIMEALSLSSNYESVNLSFEDDGFMDEIDKFRVSITMSIWG